MIEEKLKSIIINKYSSVRNFSNKIGLPYTTVDSILKRGIKNASISNVIAICDKLNIDVDGLTNNEIIFKNNNATSRAGDEPSELEILYDKTKDYLTKDDIETIKFIIEKRKKEIDEQLNEK